jgi:hypothetical protein
MTDHKLITLGERHAPFQWTYADETEREAATGFTADDLYGFALQLDDFSVWILTATTPTWTEMGGGGGGGGSFVFLEQHIASASASLDFVLLSDTYNDYLLKITGLIPASAGTNLRLRFATDATPTWDAGSNYRWTRQYWNSDGVEGSTGDGGGDTNIQIGAVIATTAGWSFNADIRLSNLRHATLYKSLNSKAEQLISSDSKLYGIHTVGFWNGGSSKAFGIRLLMSSGNITSGAAQLYGILDS